MVVDVDTTDSAVTEPLKPGLRAEMLERALLEQASRSLSIAHSAVANAGTAVHHVWEYRVAMAGKPQPLVDVHKKLHVVLNDVSTAIKQLKSLMESLP